MGIAIFCILAGIMALIIVLHHNPFADQQEELLKKIIACVLIMISCVVFILLYDKLTVLPMELFENRRLIWKLAKNDFKKRYAGSYLGIIWALIQPVVTVFMYWFVFENYGFQGTVSLQWDKYALCTVSGGRALSLVLFF